MDGEKSPRADRVQLTPLQLEILRLTALGGQSVPLSRRLGISETTFRRQLRAARRKLGAENTAHAIYLSTKLGLI